jgi:hypothetical protein
MPARPMHPETNPVVLNVRSLGNRQNQPMLEPSANSQNPPPKRGISVPPGEWNSSQGGISVHSTIQGQNSTPSSLLNNFRVADITLRVTSTPSATQ